MPWRDLCIRIWRRFLKNLARKGEAGWRPEFEAVRGTADFKFDMQSARISSACKVSIQRSLESNRGAYFYSRLVNTSVNNIAIMTNENEPRVAGNCVLRYSN